ncbi:MAG: esterase/lipase family protein [Planctomycetota bacterium]
MGHISWRPLALVVPLVVAAATAGAAAPALPLAPAEEPLPAAQRSLRKAEEYLAASCEMLQSGHRHALDGYYVACQEAWNAVQLCPQSPEVLCRASELYADALAGFLEAACRQGRIRDGGVWVGPPGRLVKVPLTPKALPVPVEAIASLEPQAQSHDKRITRRHLRDGFGLPVAVRLDARKLGGADERFAADRQSLAATAVLRFDMPGGENVAEKFVGPVARDHAAAVLDLANPVEIAAVKIGPARPHLAADLSAPLLDMLAGMPQSGIEGFLQPFGRSDTRARLEFLEPHQPGRIPVVFIHGLASDEGTWFDLINELRAWPEFHRRFEPWVFHYPTGSSFLQASANLRRELASAVAAVDPEGRDPALEKIVLVGHSMGGLHAKLMVVDSGTAIWDSIATVPFDQMRLSSRARATVQQLAFFKPLPFVKRVVFIATPHRGSVLASLGVGRVASLAVREPAEIAAIREQAEALNPGALRPEYATRVPTTVDLLQPGSPTLQAIERLRPACWVATHSIVGDVHPSLTGGRDDCVVPVESAHAPWALSEIFVPARHTKVHHHPRTVAEVQRILRLHLAELGP